MLVPVTLWRKIWKWNCSYSRILLISALMLRSVISFSVGMVPFLFARSSYIPLLRILTHRNRFWHPKNQICVTLSCCNETQPDILKEGEWCSIWRWLSRKSASLGLKICRHSYGLVQNIKKHKAAKNRASKCVEKNFVSDFRGVEHILLPDRNRVKCINWQK